MAKLDTKKSTKIHRCLLFGPPKTGKTLLAGKLAEHYNLIWIDLENGHETLFQLPKEWQHRIELISIPDTNAFPMAIQTCLHMVKHKCTICEEHGKTDCIICKREDKPAVAVDLPNLRDMNTVVVFDSGTQLSASAIAHITKGKPDDYKLERDDWGNLGKLMDIFYSHIQQSNYHCIVISHEVEAVTEGKKNKIVPVAGTRNFSRNVAKFFDDVVYCEVRNKKHTFASSTTYATNILTGSRSDVAIEDAQEPSLLEIFRPDLYEQDTIAAQDTPATAAPTTKVAKVTTVTTIDPANKGGNISAKDILARLRK